MSHRHVAHRSASLRRRGLVLVTTVAMLVSGGISLAVAPGANAVPLPTLACDSVATQPYTLAPNQVLTVSLDYATCRTASVPASGYFGVSTVDLHFLPSVGMSYLGVGQTASDGNYDSVTFRAPSTVQAAAVQFTVGSLSFEITVATTPGAPSGLSATGGASKIDLAWSAPVSDGGSGVTGYRIDVSDTDASSGFTTLVVAQPGLTYADSSLADSATRYYRVYAINLIGTSATYAEATATTDPAPGSNTVPGAPASGSATGGAGSIDLGWTAPVSDGGAPLTGYRIDVSDVSDSAGFTTLVTTQPGLSYADTGLGNGVSRWYRVYAINAQGTSGYLALSGTTDSATVPGAPGRQGARVTSPTSADVYFAAPSSDGLSPIDHYTVTSSPVGGTGTLAGADGGRVRITGLTTGTTYTFTVTATNGVGTSEPSWPTNAVTPVLPPANDDIENAVALAAGTVSATGDITLATLQQGEYNGFRFSGPHTVWFTWTAPESSTGTATIDTCGSTIDTNLAVFAAGTFTTPLAEDDDFCNFTSSVTLRVTPGASYSIQVSGATEETFGAFVLHYSVAGATVPGAPASGSATGGAGSIGLAWTAPRSNGGDTVTDYRIDVSDVSAVGPFTTLVATQPGLSYSDTGLGDGVTRWYRVYAINGKGTGGSYLALSGTSAIPVMPTPGGGGGSSSPAVDSGSGSSEPAVAKVPVVAAPVRPQAATSLIRQTARIKAPSSRRFAVGTQVVLAKKAVKTNAGVTIRWSRVKASKGICSVATVRGRAVATMLKPGTCTVVGKAAAPSSAYTAFQTIRLYRVR